MYEDDACREFLTSFVFLLVSSIRNILIPNVAKLLIIFEQHASEDDRQKSMYLKITVFRWVNTALLLKISSPLTRQLLDSDTDLIPSINALLISEMFLPPLITIADMMGNLSKHYFAPRAKTMHQMLLCFKGTPYNLAEKYTVSLIVIVAYIVSKRRSHNCVYRMYPRLFLWQYFFRH
jgi:hypothetical protein